MQFKIIYMYYHMFTVMKRAHRTLVYVGIVWYEGALYVSSGDSSSF